MYKTTLKIDGMACSMCEAHICDCIRNNFNVKKVKASHKKGECEIISQEALDEQKLKGEISKTGYKVVLITREPYVKKGLFSK